MKLLTVRFLLVLLLICINPPLSFAGIYNNSGTTSEDSIAIVFQPLDSLGSPVDLAEGDSVYLVVFYPGGKECFRDSMAHNSSRITVSDWEDWNGAQSYTFRDAVAAIDGGGMDGTYTYILTVDDNTGADLRTSVRGEFQLLRQNNLSALAMRLDSLRVTATRLLADVEAVAGSTVAGSGLAEAFDNDDVTVSGDLEANLQGTIDGITDVVNVSVTQWNGTSVAAVSAGGYPKVDVQKINDNAAAADSAQTFMGDVANRRIRRADSVIVAPAGGSSNWSDAQRDSVLRSLSWSQDNSLVRVGDVGVGSGTKTLTVILIDTSGIDDTIPDVLISVKDAGQTANLAQGRTLAPGQVSFGLNAATSYVIVPALTGYVWPSSIPIATTAGSAPDTMAVLGHDFDPGTPSSAPLCRVYGWLTDLSSVEIADAEIRARINESSLRYQNVIISPYERVTASDTTGYWYLDLYPSELLTPNTTRYEFEIRSRSGAILRRKVTVPNNSSWQLTW